MSINKENIIHKRQFQNANQIVTVEIKSKPKLTVKPKVARHTFKRDCALKNEIDRAKNKHTKPKTVNDHQKMMRKEKNFGLPAKKQPCDMKHKDKNDRIHATWKEFLAAKNILPQEDISDTNLESEISLGSDSVATSVRRNPFPRHLPVTKKSRNVSLQCNMSECAQTVPMRYMQPSAISSRQMQNNNRLKHFENINNNHKEFSVNTNIPQTEISNDQTHTPFGESALHLLHQLKERLRSRGDSESSDLVNQLEAHIGARSGSGKRLKDGIDEVFKFPPVIEHKSAQEDVAAVKNKDQTTIESQKHLIEQLQKSNEELRDLSAKLLEYHQKVAKYTTAQNTNKDEAIPVKLSNSEKAEVGAEETNEGLKLERDVLLKKINSQKDLIFNLGVKLEKAENELQRAKIDFNSMSARSGTSGVVSGSVSNQKLGYIPTWNRPDSRAKLTSKTRSDTDSAFDDRSVSLSESKRSSPRRSIVERILGTDEGSFAAPKNTIVPRRAVAVLPEREDLSLTQRSDYTDEEAANVLLANAFPAETSRFASQFYESAEVQTVATFPGKVMESTRISSDNLSPKHKKQTMDLSGDESYNYIQPELKST